MARLSFSLLGPVSISLDGQPVSGFAYYKARALLVYLAVEANQPHHRDALVGMLWPELPNVAARTNLRQVLANLRQILDSAATAPPFLLITRDTVQFNPMSDYELDVATFTHLLALCANHAHRRLEVCRSCIQRMQQAVALYRGDFLAEFVLSDSAPFAEWQLLNQERLHQQTLTALMHLTDYYEQRGDDQIARSYAQRQIEFDPWREEAHRQLMRLLMRGGQRSAALAQYAACRRILADAFGVEPAAETTALYERIRHGGLDLAVGESGSSQRSRIFNVPTSPTPLIGREAELAELGALLENPACRLITIVGLGGIGKTRLALAAASEWAEVFTHGAAFVPLAALTSARFMASTIMSALGLSVQGQRNPFDQLLDYLRDKELLLVLDNVEQLLPPDVCEADDAAGLLVRLLYEAPHTTLLVTSRERLALHGEWLFSLTGLSYPLGERVDALEAYSSVQLFMQRAHQVHRHFSLDESEARAVVRICQVVEGLPLAIELAAAALRGRSCAAIAAAMATSLALLTDEPRAVPTRHRSIRAAFEHSWQLLSAEERLVFLRLSVFRGGFEDSAAAQVAQASQQLLIALSDRSLLRWDGVARYDMHELVRQYASEKCEQAGEVAVIGGQHAAYFLTLAETAVPQLYGAEQLLWLERLGAEHDNLRAALTWSQTAGAADLGLRLAVALGRFWYVRGLFGEGRRWLEEGLAHGDSAAPACRAQALSWAASFAAGQTDLQAAHALHSASITLFRTLGDKVGCADALTSLAWLACDTGRYAQAQVCAAEAVALSREVSDRHELAMTLTTQGYIADGMGDLLLAHASATEALALFDEIGDSWNSAGPLNILGSVALHQGDNAAARTRCEQALALWRATQDKVGMVWGLRNLGAVLRAEGDYVGSRECFMEGLRIEQQLGHVPHIALCLLGLALAAHACEQPGHAARLFAAVEALCDAGKAAIPPADRATYDCAVAHTHIHLGDAAFAAAWAAGRALTFEGAIALTEGEAPPNTDPLSFS